MTPSSARRLALAFAALLASGCAGSGGSSNEPSLRREETEVVEFRARVSAIDLDKRLVTLRDESGGEATFQADEAVKNLPQVRVGDELVGQLAESVVLELREPTAEERAAGADILEVTASAEPGEKPAGVYVRQITAVLTIEAIDEAAGTATLRGPAGNSATIPARNPANLKKVKVGDTVVATYTEALKLEVRSPAAP
jgi:hypothetical protein